MPELIIIRGLPGSGKSTLAKTMNCFHVEADMGCIDKGVYNWNPRVVKRNHSWCQRTVFDAMYESMDVVVSNTFTQIWEMKPYLSKAKELGFNIKIIRCCNNFANIHNVPDEVIDKMSNRFESVEGEVMYYA